MMKYSLYCFLVLLLACQAQKSQFESKTIPIGQIITPQGEMLFYFHDSTEQHQNSFLKLAGEQYWDTLTFNRLINTFVIQGGCPDTPEGFANSPYLIDPEFTTKAKHSYGAVGAGRDENPAMQSAGCQFYIVHNKNGLPRLDDKYTIFGQIFKGFDVLESIATSPTDSLDAPITEIPLTVKVIQMTEKEWKEKAIPNKE